MLKRTLVMLAAPGLIAGGFIFSAGTAAAAAAAPVVECKLYSINDTSIASCRYSRDYVHWIRCQNGEITAELTEEFTGRRNHLSCPAGYELVNQSIGI